MRFLYFAIILVILNGCSHVEKKSQTKILKPNNLNQVETPRISEDLAFYIRFVEKMKLKDEVGMKAQLNNIIMKYPQSHFADTAIFLMGKYYFDKNEYGKSLELFNRILRDYKNGSKVVSALYYKGKIFKEIGLNKYAQDSYVRVKKNFPGSPESQRAELETKAIR